MLRELEQAVGMQMDASARTMQNASVQLLDAFVDSVFEFADQPLLPSQVRTYQTININSCIYIFNHRSSLSY
jgi:hypothetical protein